MKDFKVYQYEVALKGAYIFFKALLTGEPMRYFAEWKIDAFQC